MRENSIGIDDIAIVLKIRSMKSTRTKPAKQILELEAAVELAAKPKHERDPELVRQACERMDRRREAVRKKHGLLNIAVPAIRELRDA